MKELLYRLMTSEQGKRLRHIAVNGSPTNRIARAIEWIQNHYTEVLRMEMLAQHMNMSVSSLHHHFKNVTTLSPLQYQKQLRLQEARRMLLGQNGDVGSVAIRVGYDSPSQFSREYSRLFGGASTSRCGAAKAPEHGGVRRVGWRRLSPSVLEKQADPDRHAFP